MVSWLKNCVFYQVYPSSFMDSNGDGMGDINGIADKLEYIKNLGCDAIWINPPFQSAWKDGGYDIINHKKVDKRLGTNEDLFALFRKAHYMGMRVLIDLVPGHTSDKHPWFRASCKPRRNKYTNRFVWTDSVYTNQKEFKTVNGTTDRNGNYVINWFSSQPALNYGFYKPEEPWQLPMDHPDCAATTEALIDVMDFWLKNGCDGFRVDMAGQMVKKDLNGVGNIRLWQQIFQRIRPKYPEAAFISEWFNFEQSFAAGFDMDFYHTCGYSSFTRENMGKYDDSYIGGSRPDNLFFLKEYGNFYKNTVGKGYMSLFSGNHDYVRIASAADNIGVTLALAVILTLPGVPYIYYGDEIGLKHNFNLYSKEGGFYRTGCRTPMQWDNSNNNGFSSADEKKLFLPIDKMLNPQNAEICIADKDSIYSKIKTIIAIRKKYADLQADGPFEVVYASENEPAFLYRRGSILIAVNAKSTSGLIPVIGNSTHIYSIGAKAVLSNGMLAIPEYSFNLLDMMNAECKMLE